MLYPGDLLWCRLAISPNFFAPEESGFMLPHSVAGLHVPTSPSAHFSTRVVRNQPLYQYHPMSNFAI